MSHTRHPSLAPSGYHGKGDWPIQVRARGQRRQMAELFGKAPSVRVQADFELQNAGVKNKALSRRKEVHRAGVGLLAFDRRVSRGEKILAGVDEAGRGPLAGPVVASAVVLGSGTQIPGLDDSKRLTPSQREELFGVILSEARAVSWTSVGERLIDSTDILRASIMAMTWSVESLCVEPEVLLVDGPYRLPVRMEQEALVGGDGASLAVAAASVVAKVTRDRLMIALDSVYPQYFFKSNKGYPTKAHLESLSRHGPCPAHRLSFGPVRRCSESL